MARTETITYTYYCDNCGDKLELFAEPHILIEDAWRFGYVEYPNWQVPNSRRHRRTYHFCDIHCLDAFLKNIPNHGT